jgi:hypothetical protein
MRSHKLNSFKFLIGTAAFFCALLCTFSSTAFAKEWLVHKTNMNLYDSDIAKHEGEIKALIEQKRKTEDPAELRVITQAMVDNHKEIEKIDKKRREEILHMRFQHPEKGEHIKREYTRGKIKTLEEMENEFGLDAKLNRVQAKIRQTYGTEKPTEKAEKPTEIRQAQHNVEKTEVGEDGRTPASEDTPDHPADADERIHFSK